MSFPTDTLSPEPAAWLNGRFGPSTEEMHLVVDGKHRFARGALVYANTSRPDPQQAIGVILREAPSGQAGAVALVSSDALRKIDRFIVEELEGPIPARIKRG